jgi:hypothetical protein
LGKNRVAVLVRVLERIKRGRGKEQETGEGERKERTRRNEVSEFLPISSFL